MLIHLEVRRAVGAGGRAWGGRSITEGRDGTAGLSEGVLPADDPPLSSVNNPRAESPAEGDGTGPESSGFPASGRSPARCLPFSISARELFVCLMRNSWSSAADNEWRSVFPVVGFKGIKLHFCFLELHRWHAPLERAMHFSPASMHRRHCHRLLSPSRLRGLWHT